MASADLPSVVVDAHGMLRFAGCTAAERLAALDEPAATTISRGERRAAGTERAARREGAWRYSIGGDEPFVVHFVDDQPVSPPAGWHDDDWPRPSLEHHRARREVLEIVLREYRRPEDLERISRLLVPRYGNALPVIRGLMDALGVSLGDAKMALEAACEPASARAPSRPRCRTRR